MRRFVVCLALGVMATWFGGRPVAAYPIPPKTLWDLAGEADLVVLATVVKTAPLPSKDDGWDSAVAVLAVKEVWKGKAGRELRVPYPRDVICPAPPRYEVPLDVLAFLVRGRSGKLSTVGLSYGTLYPDLRELPVLRTLIEKAVVARTAGADLASARTEWAVSAAEDPSTRWHGLYELDSSSDGMHAFYDERARADRKRLSEDQLGRLLKAFWERPRLDHTMPMMLALIGGRPSEEVDRTAVAAVDTLMDGRHLPVWTPDLIRLTKARLAPAAQSPSPPPPRKTSDKEAPDLLADPVFAGLDRDEEQLRKEWATFRRGLAFPAKRIPLPASKTVRGVGPDSPP